MRPTYFPELIYLPQGLQTRFMGQVVAFKHAIVFRWKMMILTSASLPLVINGLNCQLLTFFTRTHLDEGWRIVRRFHAIASSLANTKNRGKLWLGRQ
jgi:hypothetical protein